MNLTEMHLEQTMERQWKLHLGTWNQYYCIRAYEYDNDTWALTVHDLDAIGYKPSQVAKILSDADIKIIEHEVYQFRNVYEAGKALDIIKQLVYDWYKKGRPITYESDTTSS